MKNNIAIIVNTFSNYSDLWKMFFDKLDKHIPDFKRYIFVDKDIPDKNSIVFHYNPNDKFRTQFLSCIKKVEEEYCIFISEDYIMYVNVLDQNKQITFIRFAKGMDFGEPRFKNYDDLYELSHAFPYFYSQTAGIWRTRDLEKIFQNTPDSHIAGLNMSQQFEILASKKIPGKKIQIVES